MYHNTNVVGTLSKLALPCRCTSPGWGRTKDQVGENGGQTVAGRAATDRLGAQQAALMRGDARCYRAVKTFTSLI